MKGTARAVAQKRGSPPITADLDLDSIGETSRDITSLRIAKNLYFIFSKVVGKTLDIIWSYFTIPNAILGKAF